MIPDPNPGAHNLIFFSWADASVTKSRSPVRKIAATNLLSGAFRLFPSSPSTGEDKGRGDSHFLPHPHPDPSTLRSRGKELRTSLTGHMAKLASIQLKLRQTLGEDFS